MVQDMNTKSMDNELHLDSISAFKVSTKDQNGNFNEIREKIIRDIINNKIPDQYYRDCKRWLSLREQVHNCLNALIGPDWTEWHITATKKGGRKFHYDFDLIARKESVVIHKFLEFKFNASCVSKTPQFVSPCKPSRYMMGNYETYYYIHYLPSVCELAGTTLPEKEEYLKTIGTTSPKCVTPLKQKYKSDKEFDKQVKAIVKKSIVDFLTRTELKSDELEKYLLEKQIDKTYVLYHNGTLYIETLSTDMYRVKRVIKQPEKNRFICEMKDGTWIGVLLRWKNGNGIAFPALQISILRTQEAPYEAPSH